MSSLLDTIGATMVFGVLVFLVVDLNVFALETNTQNALTSATQESVIGNELAVGATATLEADLVKAGYRCTLSPAITVADSDRITFKGDFDNDGDVDSVRYAVGDVISGARDENTHLRAVSRRFNSDPPISHWLEVTSFRFRYFDERGRRMTTPISLSLLPTIRSIQVQMTVANRTRLQNSWDHDFAEVYSETFVSPANIQ